MLERELEREPALAAKLTEGLRQIEGKLGLGGGGWRVAGGGWWAVGGGWAGMVGGGRGWCAPPASTTSAAAPAGRDRAERWQRFRRASTVLSSKHASVLSKLVKDAEGTKKTAAHATDDAEAIHGVPSPSMNDFTATLQDRLPSCVWGLAALSVVAKRRSSLSTDGLGTEPALLIQRSASIDEEATLDASISLVTPGGRLLTDDTNVDAAHPPDQAEPEAGLLVGDVDTRNTAASAGQGGRTRKEQILPNRRTSC